MLIMLIIRIGTYDDSDDSDDYDNEVDQDAKDDYADQHDGVVVDNGQTTSRSGCDSHAAQLLDALMAHAQGPLHPMRLRLRQ